MKSSVTMQDIADRFGVSKVTVSKALNDKEGVSDDLKERIQKTAEDMGYRFNTIARSLKNKATYNIGVVIAERFLEEDENAFYMGFYKEIAHQLDERKYSAILNMLREEDENALRLPRVYHDNKVDGMIILGQVSDAYLDLTEKMAIPIMFLDFYDEHANVDSVITDNFFGAYDLTNYLMKNGHKKIAYVGDIFATSSIQDRYLGYYKSLLEHGTMPREDYVIKDRDQRGQFIKLDLPKDMPTAFVCNCDQIAHQLIRALTEDGYDVPGDISVVSFDNSIYAKVSIPPITTVEVNVKEMSQSVINRMLAKIQDKDTHYGRIAIKGTIIHRESVRALN